MVIVEGRKIEAIPDEVLVGNMKPTKELEMYLKLVNRLETKINTIKNTIGLDQGVLDSRTLGMSSEQVNGELKVYQVNIEKEIAKVY